MRYRQAGRRRGLFRQVPVQAAADACSGVLHPVIWLSDGTMAAWRITFSLARGDAAWEKLYQQQSLISSTPKCSLWLLQITKDLTETMSMILFRSCSALSLWLSARMQLHLPGARCWDRHDLALRRHVPELVRLFRSAGRRCDSLAIEQAWQRLCHQAPHIFLEVQHVHVLIHRRWQALRAGESSRCCLPE